MSRFFFTHLFGPPNRLGLGLLVPHSQGQRPVIEAGEEEQVAHLSRGGDRHTGPCLERFGPVEFSRLGIEPIGRFRMPDDKLPLAAGFEDHRRTVTRLFSR